MKTVFSISLIAVASLSFAVDYTAAGGSIPDNNLAGFVSTITTVPALASVSAITITGLKHTWAGDLTAVVTAPGGATVTIFQKINAGTSGQVGDSSAYDGTYVFTVGSPSLWTAGNAVGFGVAIPAGPYSPSGNLFTGAAATSYTATNYSAFAGTTAGSWSIKISDNAAADTGSFTSWTLSGTPAAVPEPATMAVLGLGLAAMARRRKKA